MSRHSTVTFHQLYGRLRYGKLQLTVGRRTQSIGRVDTSLSLGSTTHSRNAPPIPRVSISSDGYVAVPGTGETLAFKGYLAHGWLESDRFVENALLHESYLYGRVFPPEFPINAHAGITHHVVWGGTHPEDGPQQVSLARWADVLIGNEVIVEGLRKDPPTFDPNHLAMYDFSLSVDFGVGRGLVYRQFYHEDIPSLNFRNVWDGLWGVSLRWEDPEAFVRGILWEHLRMTRQSARFSEEEERGIASYYNHGPYRGGWTYQGWTLGTPLLTPFGATGRLNSAIPGIANNIVVAHQIGVEGNIGVGISYQLLGTYSRNYGARNVCATRQCTSFTDRLRDRRDQYSFQLGVSGPLFGHPNLRFCTAVALDTGDFYDERVGLSVAFEWHR